MEAILVVGAYGFFGGLLVAELLKYSNCYVILGGRNNERLKSMRQKLPQQWQQRTEIKKLDLNIGSSLDDPVSRVKVAVCAAGPFQQMPHTLLKSCLAHNVHYLDLCDDRGFLEHAHRLAQASTKQVAVCSGWSSMPALSALLADIAGEGMQRIDYIRIQIAPGHRNPRNYATVASLLASVGRPFQIWQQNKKVAVTGWSSPQEFKFPLPIGARVGYLVDVPDHELFPGLFNAATVEFRVGAEIAVFNQACSLLAGCIKAGIVATWLPWASLIKNVLALTGFLGHDWGGLGVECKGLANKEVICRRACIVALHQGHYIPVMPAAIMCSRLLKEEHNFEGIAPLKGWLPLAELKSECSRRNYDLYVQTLRTPL